MLITTSMEGHGGTPRRLCTTMVVIILELDDTPRVAAESLDDIKYYI
jgi:hypothetical protein